MSTTLLSHSNDTTLLAANDDDDDIAVVDIAIKNKLIALSQLTSIIMKQN